MLSGLGRTRYICCPSSFLFFIYEHLKLTQLASSISLHVAGGQCRVSKYLQLGMTIRHVTGSAEGTSLLSHIGRCVSCDSLQQLETVLANIILHRFLLVTISVSDKVLHLFWGNFDLKEEAPTGSGTTHSIHGIVLQEVPREGHEPPAGSLQNVLPTREVQFWSCKGEGWTTWLTLCFQPDVPAILQHSFLVDRCKNEATDDKQLTETELRQQMTAWRQYISTLQKLQLYSMCFTYPKRQQRESGKISLLWHLI